MFEANDVAVVFASVDSKEKTTEFILDTGLPFPMGYDLPLEETARKLGLFFHREKGFFHAAGFIVNPAGVVVVAAYSSGAVGRLDPETTLELIDIVRDG